MDLITDGGNAEIPKYKWRILKKEEAARLKLELVTIDEDRTLLVINLDDIPQGWELGGFLDFITRNGIVLLEKR